MKYTILLLGICFLLINSSCRKEELIGREVQVGDNDILLLTTDSFHITAKTVAAERERTDERFEGMLGAYSDPVFGFTTIIYNSQYHLEQEGFTFPADAILDSAFVSFRLTGGYREKSMDSEEKNLMHFQVYELDQDLFLEEIYYSDEESTTKPVLIGEFNALMGLTDSTYINGSAQPPQIRIQLDDTWAQQIMTSDTSNFENNDNFTQFFKGLSIQPQLIQQTGENGAIYYFNPLSGFTNITFYYHTSNDTTKFSFIPSSQTANYMQFTHDYSNSQIETILDDTAKGSVQLYLQATIGTDIELELKDIVSKFGSNPKIINRAELFIPVDTLQDYYPLNKLSVSRKLENGTAEFLPDQVQPGDRGVDGFFNSDSSYYRFLITQYVQEIIHNYSPGDIKSEVLLISPFGNNIVANRSVVSGPRPTEPKEDRMKIVITYTPLNQ